MKIEQIYTGCLAQGAYYIESKGEVAIIDPLREVQPYIEKAKAANATIKYIFETHFHADFVSGHVTLAKESGAPIVYGPNANPTFDAIIAKTVKSLRLESNYSCASHSWSYYGIYHLPIKRRFGKRSRYLQWRHPFLG
jgi:hydroxyacylglutathione hydrolase